MKLWIVMTLYVLCMAAGLVVIANALDRGGGLRCIVGTIWEGQTPMGCPRHE